MPSSITFGREYSLSNKGLKALELMNKIIFNGRLSFNAESKVSVIGNIKNCNCGSLTEKHFYYCESKYREMRLCNRRMILSTEHIEH